MYKFHVIDENETIYASLAKINESLAAVLSNSAGTVLPEMPAQDLIAKGQTFYHESENKLYQLTDVDSGTWKMIVDLNKTPTDQEYVDNQITTHRHDALYLGINAPSVDTLKVNGTPAAEVLNQSDIIDNPDDPSAGDTDKVWSARLAKKLQDDFNTWLETVGSPDDVIDELNRVLELINANTEILESLEIGNIAGLQAALDSKLNIAGTDAATLGGVLASGGTFTGAIQFNSAIKAATGRDMLKSVGEDVFLQNLGGLLYLNSSSDPVVRVGSGNTQHKIFHEGNTTVSVAALSAAGLLKTSVANTTYLKIGAKAADSSKLNGVTNSANSTANTIAQRDANADLQVRYLRTEGPAGTAVGDALFFLAQKATGDGAESYAKPYTRVQVKQALSLDKVLNWGTAEFEGHFAKKSHTHTIAQVTDLQNQLNGKVPTGRTITAGTGLSGGGNLSQNITLTATNAHQTHTAAQIPNLPASKVTSEVFHVDRIPTLTPAKVGLGSVINTAQMRRFSGTITSHDWNASPRLAGTYTISDAKGANKPGAYGYGTLLVLNYDDSMSTNKVQLYFPENASSADTTARLPHFRSGWGTGFGNWRALATTTYVTNTCYTKSQSNSTFAAKSHTHDDRYYTESESNSRFAAKSHNHDSAYLKIAGGTISGSLTVNGNIVCRNNITAYQPSDERLKENVVLIPNALEKVCQLRGVTFDWKEHESLGLHGSDIGVIAQDVEKVAPEIVGLANFDRDEKNNSLSGENYLSVQYEKICSLLIEAIKELKQEVDELKRAA